MVEDERRLANIIKKGLSEEGFAVDMTEKKDNTWQNPKNTT